MKPLWTASSGEKLAIVALRLSSTNVLFSLFAAGSFNERARFGGTVLCWGMQAALAELGELDAKSLVEICAQVMRTTGTEPFVRDFPHSRRESWSITT